jgi:hypothetical protein
MLDGLQFETKVPAKTELVCLPMLSSPGGRVRLGLHVDTLLSVLKGFANIPDRSHLHVEARVINEQQLQELRNNPISLILNARRFYRHAFAEYVANNIPNLNIEELVKTTQSVITPADLADAFGYSTVWYNTGSLVDYWQNNNVVDGLLPLFESATAFRIGSDTLTRTQIRLAKRAVLSQVTADDKALDQKNRQIAQQNGLPTYDRRYIREMAQLVSSGVDDFPDQARNLLDKYAKS